MVASCVANVQYWMQNVVALVTKLMTIRRQCGGSPHSGIGANPTETCILATTQITSYIASLAKFTLSIAGSCAGKSPPGDPCGREVTTTVEALSQIIGAATITHQSCKPRPPTTTVAPGEPAPSDTVKAEA